MESGGHGGGQPLRAWPSCSCPSLPPVRWPAHLCSAAAFLAGLFQLLPADRGRGLARLGTGFHQDHPAALRDHARVSGHSDRGLKVVTWEVKKWHRQLTLELVRVGAQGPTLSLVFSSWAGKVGRRTPLGCQRETCPPPFLAQKAMPLPVPEKDSFWGFVTPKFPSVIASSHQSPMGLPWFSGSCEGREAWDMWW